MAAGQAALAATERAPAARLSTRLEEATAEARQSLQQSVLLQALFRDARDEGVYGEFIRATHYVTYLRQLHVLYTAFEALLPRVRESTLAQVLWLPELRRASALEADLLWFCGSSRTDLFACAETRLHAERMREVAEEAPHLLLGHAYARCTQDLFLGPRRARLIADAFTLEGGGTAFYNAVSAQELPGFRARLHARLNGLALSETEAQEVIQEARLAFRLHTHLCAALARGAQPSQSGTAWE